MKIKSFFLLSFFLFILAQASGNAFGGACLKGNCVNGYGTYTWRDGAKYVGEYRDGKRHGQGTKTWPDGTVKRGIWENGKLVQRVQKD